MSTRINVSGLHRQGGELGSVLVAQADGDRDSERTTETARRKKTLLVVAQVRDVCISSRSRAQSAASPLEALPQQDTSSESDHVMLEVSDLENRLCVDWYAEASSGVTTGSVQQGSVVVGPVATGTPVLTQPIAAALPDGQLASSTGVKFEVHVRCRSGVMVRLSLADVTRAANMVQNSAASIAELAALVSGHGQVSVSATTDGSPKGGERGGVVDRGDALTPTAGLSPLLLGKAVGNFKNPLSISSRAGGMGEVEEGRACANSSNGWQQVLVSSLRACSFKGDGVRLMFLECRDGGALGTIRLPLLTCQLEVSFHFLSWLCGFCAAKKRHRS